MRKQLEFQPDPVIEAYKKDVDVTLLRENLKLTPEQRIRKLQDHLAFFEEIQRAGREARKKAAATSEVAEK